jgi:hypothetical protein
VLILALVVGIVAGLFAGGRITNIANVRLRWVGLLFLGLLIRYGTQWAIDNDVPYMDLVRLPLFIAGFFVLLLGLWLNREQPGFPLAFVGVLLNAGAIIINGGAMPVWEPSVIAAGLNPADITSSFYRLVGETAAGRPAARVPGHAGPLGDIIPIPIPVPEQRREHRRPLPVVRPRVLPVRGHSSAPPLEFEEAANFRAPADGSASSPTSPTGSSGRSRTSRSSSPRAPGEVLIPPLAPTPEGGPRGRGVPRTPIDARGTSIGSEGTLGPAPVGSRCRASRRSSRASGAIPTSASRSTARSAPCGPDS